MKIKSLFDLEASYQKTRLQALVFAGFCLAVVVAALFFAFRSAQEARNVVYLLHNGEVFPAVARSAADNRYAEIHGLVEQFHLDFYTLPVNETLINRNVRKALKRVADRSANDEYERLVKRGYYLNLLAGDASQQIIVDSILVNLQSYPYPVTTFARQVIKSPRSETTRLLVTECLVEDSPGRTLENPAGFQITSWRVKENRDVETISK